MFVTVFDFHQQADGVEESGRGQKMYVQSVSQLIAAVLRVHTLSAELHTHA